jgi:hydrogenase nickel incorporation protein HypB
MCNVCGCGTGETRIEGEAIEVDHHHVHTHDDGTAHSHAHGHEHDHAHGDHDHLHYGEGPAHAHAPGMTQARMVQIEEDILGKNNAYARANREWLADHGVFALNFVSSPGSGKTTLLVRTIDALKKEFPVAVIEGDQQTSFDAERIRATGARALQINTGKGCHLDAHMVGHAIEHLGVVDDSLLLVENVGNLVCPAAFDLGEAHKVVILSVTEGEDKPLKYPDMFRAADLMLLNKADLLPHLSFNVNLALEYARRVNPKLRVIQTSSTSGEGFDEWLAWLRAGVAQAQTQRVATVEALRDRVAELERQLAARA